MGLDVEGIRSKLNLLRRSDPNCLLFGAGGRHGHNYLLNPCLDARVIAYFEEQHGIELPTDYKSFLFQIGNGGPGPGYGLFPLGLWNYELDIEGPDFLAASFPHAEDMPAFEELEDASLFKDCEENYYSSCPLRGSIRISNFGCGNYFHLVVTGQQAGMIWLDDRASYFGIHKVISAKTKQPQTFSDWYSEWLDESLSKCSSGASS